MRDFSHQCSLDEDVSRKDTSLFADLLSISNLNELLRRDQHLSYVIRELQSTDFRLDVLLHLLFFPGDRMRTVESLSTAEAAYIGASQLSDRVAERMRQVVETTRNATPDEVRRRRLAANSGVARSLLNSPATARQAVIASLLLGPPKAMEN